VTAVAQRPAAPPTPEPQPAPKQERAPVRRTGAWLAAILAVWVLGWVFLQGVATLPLGRATLTAFHARLNDLRDSFDAARDSNVILDVVVGGIRDGIDAFVIGAQDLLSQPAFPRPVPQIGWLGVVALAAWIAYALAGVRSTVLVVLSLLSFAVLGYWSESIDLLIVTFTAVLIAVAIGIPLGIAMARSRGVTAVVTPVLDVMQTVEYRAVGRGRRDADLRPAPGRADHRPRLAHGHRLDDRGHYVHGIDQGAVAAQGAAADGQADDHRRRQPDDDGCAVHRDHRGADRRPRAGRARDRGAADPRHRHRVRQRPVHRDHGDHAGPHDDGGQRAGGE
jgi:hypothetical protein